MSEETQTTPAPEVKPAETTKKSSSALKPILIAGCGCFVVLFVSGVILSMLGGYIFKKAGTGMLQNVIESKTGVKTDLSGLEKGELTFTDKETGETVEVGTGKIPADFPKDFPLYPEAKLSGSLSGSAKDKDAGYWLTFTTPDGLEKVVSYYKTNLPKSGWEETATFTANETTTWAVTKGTMEGTVAVSREKEARETTILVMLGQNSKSSGASKTTVKETPAEVIPTDEAATD